MKTMATRHSVQAALAGLLSLGLASAQRFAEHTLVTDPPSVVTMAATDRNLVNPIGIVLRDSPLGGAGSPLKIDFQPQTPFPILLQSGTSTGMAAFGLAGGIK
jgi:hypothetical protein